MADLTVVTTDPNPDPTPNPAPATEAVIELARETGAATEAARTAETEARVAQAEVRSMAERIAALEVTGAQHSASIMSELQSLRQAVSAMQTPEPNSEANSPTPEPEPGDVIAVEVDTAPADVPATPGKGRTFWNLLLGTRPTT